MEKNRMKLIKEKRTELAKWLDFEKEGRVIPVK